MLSIYYTQFMKRKSQGLNGMQQLCSFANSSKESEEDAALCSELKERKLTQAPLMWATKLSHPRFLSGVPYTCGGQVLECATCAYFS